MDVRDRARRILAEAQEEIDTFTRVYGTERRDDPTVKETVKTLTDVSKYLVGKQEKLVVPPEPEPVVSPDPELDDDDDLAEL